MKSAGLVILLSLSAICLFAREKPTPNLRLADVHSVFVKGNNQAAEKARETLEKGSTCFILATKADDADAILDLATDSNSQGQGAMDFGSFGGRNWIVNGTLTLKSGDLVWSKSERFSDSPFRSGGKVAGDILVKDLARDADCKSRR